MPASYSRDARVRSSADCFRWLKELGPRSVPTWAALETPPGGRSRLVVVERAARAMFHESEVADWLRGARRLATLEHPNLCRIRDVLPRSDEARVVSDFLDAVAWSDVMSSLTVPPLGIALRVMIDVSSGLSALHNLRNADQQPLKLVHAELTPRCVLVDLDGVGRVAGTCRLRRAGARPGPLSPYLAPEVLLADDTADARADVYSVGAILWEALSGEPLFPDLQPSAIVTQLLGGRLPRAHVSEDLPWAAPLADVVAWAMAASPDKRFGTAAAFAAELRRVAGPHLPPASAVAAFMRPTHGETVRARRQAFERGETREREVSGVARQMGPQDDGSIEIDVALIRDSNAPTPAPPPLTAPSKRAASPASNAVASKSGAAPGAAAGAGSLRHPLRKRSKPLRSWTRRTRSRAFPLPRFRWSCLGRPSSPRTWPWPWRLLRLGRQRGWPIRGRHRLRSPFPRQHSSRRDAGSVC